MASKEKKAQLTKHGELKLIEKLSKEVPFQPQELRRLIDIFKKYVKETWYMDESTFSSFMYNSFGFNEEFFMKRIFSVADTNNDNRIDLEEFIKMVSVMLRGSTAEKIHFCFKCYDLNKNDELTRDDIVTLLSKGITESPNKEENPDEFRDLADIMIQRMDENHDGVISFEEYKNACMNNWVLVEAFGQCMPDNKFKAAVLFLLEAEENMISSDEE